MLYYIDKLYKGLHDIMEYIIAKYVVYYLLLYDGKNYLF